MDVERAPHGALSFYISTCYYLTQLSHFACGILAILAAMIQPDPQKKGIILIDDVDFAIRDFKAFYAKNGIPVAYSILYTDGVDFDPDVVARYERELSSDGSPCKVITHKEALEAFIKTHAQEIQGVVSDYDMGGISGGKYRGTMLRQSLQQSSDPVVAALPVVVHSLEGGALSENAGRINVLPHKIPATDHLDGKAIIKKFDDLEPVYIARALGISLPHSVTSAAVPSGEKSR